MEEFDQVLIPGIGTEAFVALAADDGDKAGVRRYRKQILHMGRSFVHPKNPKVKIHVNKALADSLVSNFKAKRSIVQAPIVDEANAHNEDPLRNVGEIVDVDYDDKGVYVVLEDRRSAARIESEGELGKTLIGASALMHMDYPDTEHGTTVGPTLLHMAITNRPYITDLADFVPLSADSLGVDEPALMEPLTEEPEPEVAPKAEVPADEVPDPTPETPPEETTMAKPTLEELLAALKDDHGIDVVDLQDKASSIPDLQKTVAASAAAIEELKSAVPTGPSTDDLVVAFSAALKEAGAPVPKDEDQVQLSDVTAAVLELAGEKLELSNQVKALTEAAELARIEKAENEIDEYIRQGRILPKQRDVMVALSIEDPDSFADMLPDDPIVSLSAMGVTTHEAPDSEEFAKTAAEVERLAALVNDKKI